MTHEFEQWEDAVIGALEPLRDSGLKTLEPYADQLNAEEVAQVTVRFPAIYVTAGNLRITERNRYDSKVLGITLIVCDKNVRGSMAATRGDVSSPGVFELLRLSRAALHRTKILANWTPPSCKSEQCWAFSPADGLCLYAAVYEVATVGH